MGVHGLWDLLSPVGRRVSVETLAGKRLAIDASIWMIQFMKAMRDEKGEMVRNAHLLGFFRRICKLLYLRTKPVFIFDGGTPALKRRTVIARRRQREDAQAKLRKTAEKLLLYQGTQIRLQEQADELQKQRSSNNASKGKKVVTEEADTLQKTSDGIRCADSFNQEAVDEMLAASLAAEEDEGFMAGESSSGVRIQADEEDDDEDEEMILPTMQGNLDPAILAALPPSVQLDLLVQMRERLMAENRQKYQRVKKVPARFSELQIQAYLKTVAFRREIDEVQKSAAGRGIGGVQTSRIASEANREFIFSSNYNGDKIALTSTGEGRKNSDQSQEALLNPESVLDHLASSKKFSTTAGSPGDEPQRDLENDVETYLDERGRLRVSRVRAMGIRMTRDLQRNLDLMKETEEERLGITENIQNQLTSSDVTQGNAPSKIQLTSDEDLSGMMLENDKIEESVLAAGTPMEISFEDNGQHEFGGDDDTDLFAHLVAGDPIMDFSVDTSLSKKQSLDYASEPEWEEGTINDEGASLNNKIILEGKPLEVDTVNSESELRWEEGSLNMQEEASSCPAEYTVVSKGDLEEEADLQEAIRRSLQDLEYQIPVDDFDDGEKSRTAAEGVNWGIDAGFANKVEGGREWEASARSSDTQYLDVPGEVQQKSHGPDGTVNGKPLEISNPLVNQVLTHLGGDHVQMEVLPVKACDRDPSLELLMEDKGQDRTLEQKFHEFGSSVREKDAYKGQLIYTSGRSNEVAADGFETGVDDHSKLATETKQASTNDSLKDIDSSQEQAKEEVREYISNKEVARNEVTLSEGGKEDADVMVARLEEEMLILGEEFRDLGDKQRKLERNAESVSSEMFAECQELLQIFGLPFIIAPMEAEAQCAYMELVNLVDGVVTDDSDAFLFGACSVHKNIFDDRKYVETYFMKDIENELGLNREKLIRMALLLGSDYTEGVSGIGIVNAIEVVNAFPEEDGLRKFREWIESPDPSILGKFDKQVGGNLKQIESQVSDLESCSNSKLSEISASDGNASGSADEAQKIKKTFMDKHRKLSKNWHIPSTFPSEAVISAYESPQVDKSTEPFTWGKPDHLVLRKLCWEKFGWNPQKADELLLPVLREYNKRETQLRLEAFYSFNERFAKIRSQRIKKAVKGMTGNKSVDLMDESELNSPRSQKKRRGNKDVAEVENFEEVPRGKEHAGASNEARIAEKLHDEKLGEPSVGGKHGGKGSRRDHSVKKGKRKTNPSSKYVVSGSDDERYNEGGQDSLASFGEPHQVRRSGRPRKKVNYAGTADDPDEVEACPGNGNAAREEPFSGVPQDDFSAAAPSKINNTEQTAPKLSGDCIGMGESCFVEKDIQDMATDDHQLSSNRAADSRPDESQLSDEYLTQGGGFCLDDEDVTDGDMKGLHCSPTRGTISKCEPDPANRDVLGEDENSIRRMNAEEVVEASYPNKIPGSNSDLFEEDIDEDGCGKKPRRSLRAMPNLKRKRRKD